MLCQAYQADKLSLMRGETLPGQGLIIGSRTAVIGVRVDGNPSSGSKQAKHFYVLRIHEFDQVIHDYVDTVLMETSVVPEAEQVQFQALALHHPDVGDVADPYLSEIRLPCDGAESSELGAVETYPIVPPGMHVLEGFEHFRGIIHLVSGLVAEGRKSFFFPVHNQKSNILKGL